MTGPSNRRGEPSTSDTGTWDGRDDLATSFSMFARRAQQKDEPEAVLAEIVLGAVALIPGCDEGSISVVLGRRTVTSHAPSGELAIIIDDLQESLGQGPCLDAAYEHETVRVADMASETRWPKFTKAALAAGAAGMLSFQMFVEGDDLGALNLFSRTAGAFDDESEHIGLLFASHAAVAWAAAEQKLSLRRVVASRQLIGQAQGILIERHKVTADEAFTLLVRVSQHRNVKLREVAAGLLFTGRLEVPA